MYKLKPSTQQHKIQTCTNHHCQHCNSHIDVQISMYNINMAEIAKEKAKTWFRRAELIPSSLVLFIEESISSSFRSTRDCAEIAAWAAAEAASEPTMADKNATWKTLQLLSFLPQLSIFKVNNNTVQGSLWNMPATSMNTGGSVTHLCSVPPKSGITF